MNRSPVFGCHCSAVWSSAGSIKTVLSAIFALFALCCCGASGLVERITGAGGSATFTYNAQGRVQTLGLPNNLSRSFGYDSAGRVVSLGQNLNGQVEKFLYSFDSGGRLTNLNSTHYSSAYAYDSAGRLASERRSGEGAYTKSYTYDPNDNRTRMSAGGTVAIEVHTLSFEGTTLPVELQPLLGSWTVGSGKLQANPPAGESVARAWLDLGVSAGAFYSVKVRPDAAGLTVGGAEAFAGMSLAETDQGRYLAGLAVKKEEVDGQEVLTRRLRLAYLAAGAGTLETVAETDPVSYAGEELTLKLEFINDTLSASVVEDGEAAAGISALLANGSAGPLGLEAREAGAQFDDFTWETLSGTADVRDYTYNQINQLLSIRGAEATDYTYDFAGNQTRQVKDGVTTDYGYDRLNRLLSVNGGGSASTYGYSGPSWMRTSATVDGLATSYAYDGFACVSQTTNGLTTNYGVIGSTPLWENTNTTTLTYPQDGRGNVTGLFGPAGFSAKFNYDAFGNVKTTDGAGQPLANTSGPRYGGQLYDAATDRIYLRNRDLIPGIGRFGTMDPIGFAGGLNLYNYCGSDPNNYSDPMGTRILVTHESWGAFWGWMKKNTSAALEGKLKFGFPTGGEGAHSGLSDYYMPVIKSSFTEVSYNGAQLDFKKLTQNDKAFLGALASDDVYVFDDDKFRRKTDLDSATTYAKAELGLRAGINFVANPFRESLATLGDYAEKYQGDILNIDQALHQGSPGTGAVGDLGVAADSALISLKGLRATESAQWLRVFAADAKAFGAELKVGLRKNVYIGGSANILPDIRLGVAAKNARAADEVFGVRRLLGAGPETNSLSIRPFTAQGRQWRIDQLELQEFNPNLPKHVRGWLRNERRQVEFGSRAEPTTPPGYQLGHGRTTPAREGFDYSNAVLQGEDLNALEEQVRRQFGEE